MSQSLKNSGHDGGRNILLTILAALHIIKKAEPDPIRELVDFDRADGCDKALFANRDVLVGGLRNSHQLDVCLRRRFYHIPKKYVADSELPVRFIALYQSKRSFGARGAGVRYYGAVTEMAEVTRREITEIKRDSDEIYYRFSVEKWETLDTVIAARETGVQTHIMTTEYQLNNSRTVPELLIGSPDDLKLYRFMADTARKRIDGFTVRGLSVYREGKRIYCDLGEKTVFRCLVRDYDDMPYVMFLRLYNAIGTYGEKEGE